MWPKTLFGRVALIVFAGLALAHSFTILIIMRERGDLGLTMMSAYVGRDVAASVAILDRIPPAERPSWLPRLARQNYRYAIGEAPPGRPPESPMAGPVARSVTEALGPSRVGRLVETKTDERLLMYLPLRLSDGTPLTLQLFPPRPMISATSVLLLLLQLTAIGGAAWLAVRLAVRPLDRLAKAADDLAPGAPNAPLDTSGPREVAQAAQAFNAMQQRIDQQMAERMQLLAAISHDLQTPITRMKLRTELLPDAAVREKLLADLCCMQELVEEGLTYARTAHAAQEKPVPIDLHALLDGLVCDAVDAGHQAELAGHLDKPLVTRVQALRRIVTNLIDNAIKFGGRADVSVEADDKTVHISVSDRGPGIPPDHLQAVFEPFFRLEGSRSRDTGGTGLGLAIAQQLTQALGGELVLANREGGGLRARLSLPMATS